MRGILILSFAVTTALVSTAAFAANDGQGSFKRRLPGAQETLRPVLKPLGQRGQFSNFVRPPLQTIAPPVASGPKVGQFIQAQIPVPPRVTTPAPIKVDFAPVPTGPKPVSPSFRIQPAPKPVVDAPVVQIKQTLPVPAPATPTFRIQPAPKPVVDAAPVVQIKQTLPVPAPNRQIVVEGPQAAPAQPLQVSVPKIVANQVAEAPVAPKVEQPVEQPADAQQLIEGDAGAAPKVEAAPQPAPAPVAPAAPRKKIVRYYVQAEPAYDSYSQDDYGYQPQVSYSGSYSDGCE